MPERVLFIAYHFPPIGGGGVQRNAKFVRYLPRFGYEPVVITGSGGADDRWTPLDTTLDNDIPNRTDVLRVPGPEPRIKSGWPRRMERIFDRRAAFAGWWMNGIVAASERVATDVRAIYGSLVPYETADPAAEVARRKRLPWIADLQDPWALDEMWIYPTSLHRRRDLARMRRLLSSAAAIVMNTPEAVQRVRAAFPELEETPIVSIPNGFDYDDFPPARASRRTDGRFRIVHTGYLHTEEGLRLRQMRGLRRVVGGTSAPVDILTRSHVFLLDALRRMVAEDPGLNEILDVRFAGVLTNTDVEIASDLAFVQFPGYLSHQDTVELMRSADLLFLPMQDLPVGMRAGLVPGKTYEYLASGTPILATLPDGDARDILEAAGNAIVCRPSDVDGIAATLRQRIDAWRAGEHAPRPDPSVVAQFDRVQLTEQLAGVFDLVLGRATAPDRRAEDIARA